MAINKVQIPVTGESLKKETCLRRRIKKRRKTSNRFLTKLRQKEERINDRISENWRYRAFAVVKYKAEGYNSLGHYIIDEWTSFSDIGKTFGGCVFTQQEYNETEAKYIDAATAFIKFVGSSNFKIINIYKYTRKSSESFKKMGELQPHYLGLNERKDYPISSIGAILKIALREFAHLAIQLNDSFNSTIHFGYDYYMYFVSDKDITQLKPKINEIGLACFNKNYM